MDEEPRTMQVLFVCTGNTCRSPMAEAVARLQLAESGAAIRVASAGVSAVEGAPASPQAQSAISEAGGDLLQHRAQALTRAMLLESDLILTMSEAHVRLARVLAPEAADRIHRLGDYVASQAAAATDVPDPFGGDLLVYRETRDLLRDWVARGLERFVDGAKSHER